MQPPSTNYKKIILTLLITLTLFGIAFGTSYYFDTRKINQLHTVEDKISIDLLSSETQFSLLQELSCKDISTSVLSSELNSLADKITYSENNIGNDNVNVINLKKAYSLLEIKDYLLMKQITTRCGQKPIFVLYFYNNDSCADCTKQGYVLTSLRESYPNLRVYSFDYNLDLSAIKAMISIYKVPNELPALVINGKVYSGFQSIEAVEKTFPQLQTIKKKVVPKSTSSSTTTSTTTDSKSTNSTN
ncbi:MAG: hypothetical protein KGI58_03630 [Patescibacteria group bacterium]|nr:hypothetical protein [Patescibacteria group bacterium]